MYTSAIIGFISGSVVLLIELFIIKRIYSSKSRIAPGRIEVGRVHDEKDIVEGEIEVDGDIDGIREKIEQSIRFFHLSNGIKRFERAPESFSSQSTSTIFPREISYSISKGWSKSVKITYKIDFTQQKKRFKRISYFLLFLVASPIATAIPWLVFYVVTNFPEQKIQLIQLVHLWHIWWPFFPYIIYRKIKSISKTFIENTLRL